MERKSWLNRLFWLLLLAALHISCLAQIQTGIARYYQGRKAALSLTFDDGLQEHYTLLRPELNRRGLRATFAVIGSKVGGVMRSSQDKAMGISGTPCMTWEMVRQLADDGHEIGSHGWEHRNVTKLSAERLRHEVQRNDSIIREQTDRFPMCYFYPGNQKDAAAIAFCEQGRIGSRTFQTSIGSKRDVAWLGGWLDGLTARGEWGVGMTHGIASGYDHFADPQTLWTFLDDVAARRDSLWVAPFGEVSAYTRERDATELTLRQDGDSVAVIPACSLSADVYRQPLSLIVTGCVVRSAQQKGRQLRVYQSNGLQMVDFLPTEGPVLLRVDLCPHEHPTVTQ